MHRSLSLRVPPALLPSSGPEPEDSLSSSAPPSESSSLGDELRGLRLGGAPDIRGFSEASALPTKAQPSKAGPHPAVRSTLAGTPTPAASAAPMGRQLQQHEGHAGGHTAAAPAAPAAAAAVQQHAAPEVQRLGSRHPSQRGSDRASGQPTVAIVSSSGWPSIQASNSVLTDDVPAAAAARAPPPVHEASSGSSSGAASSSFVSSVGGGSPQQPSVVGAAEEESSRWATSPGSVATASTSTTAAARSARRGACRAASPARRAALPSRRSSRQGDFMSSTAAAEAKRTRPGSAGSMVSTRPPSSLASTRPGSASPQKGPARPGSARPALEARASRQMRRDPADWTVTEVCDWVDFVGLGQYRRRFVHNAVTGSLLLRLSNEELKFEVGIGPLGHREGLLAAINDLDQFWQQQQQERQAGGDSPSSSPGGSRPDSPGSLPGANADYSLQRAFAQRARVLRELEKAEGRQAHRAKAAEQAARVAGQSAEEVRKLQASLCELDRSLGWQAATQQLFDPLDVHGVRAWQPAGKQRAGRPGIGSPMRCVSPGGGGGGSGGGSPMSTVSRRLMQGGGGFLERLSADVQARQAKAAEAARRAGRYADEQLAEREREARDLRFLKEVVEARTSGLAEMLDSGDPSQLAQACDELAESCQAELGLSDEVVEAVKRLGSPGKKVARLAGALRSNQFMQRLQQDLSTRESRFAELQQRFFKLEKGNNMEQQERADLAAAQAHFGLLGWSQHDLDVAPEDTSAGCDAPLGKLLRRAAALQEARQRGKAVDWEAPDWRSDGLAAMQAERNAALQAALDARREAEVAAAAEKAAGQRYGLQSPPLRRKELPKPADHLGETVEMLAACRPAEVALLEGLSGYRKLVMSWRAVRAQLFIAFTHRDLEARKAKVAQLEAQLYPDNTKVLPKEEFEKFFDRLMTDTQRRAANRDELAEKAKAAALAKLMKSAPQPSSHRSPKSAAGSRA